MQEFLRIRAGRFFQKLFIDLFDNRIYNVLTENLTVNSIVKFIEEHTGQISIQYVDNEIMNQLSYEVSNTRFKKQGFQFTGKVKKNVAETVELLKKAGGNPCPPIIVGVGIGGSFEKAAILAKESLMRDVNDSSSNPINAKLEDELLELVNKTGIGPMGLGGRNTALSVKVETYPCHIASLPVAINLNCHAARHKEIIL